MVSVDCQLNEVFADIKSDWYRRGFNDAEQGLKPAYHNSDYIKGYECGKRNNNNAG